MLNNAVMDVLRCTNRCGPKSDLSHRLSQVLRVHKREELSRKMTGRFDHAGENNADLNADIARKKRGFFRATVAMMSWWENRSILGVPWRV